jgi:hypothetical protein
MGLLKLCHYRESKYQKHMALYIFFALVMLYAVADSRSSANLGMGNADRMFVHLTLLVLLVFLGTYYFCILISGRTRRAYTAKALLLIALWILILNLLQNIKSWSVAVQFGLSMLWLLVYSFLSNYLRRFPSAWYCVETFIKVMFAFYVLCALYGGYNLRMQYNRLVALNLAYNVLVFLPWFALLPGKWARRVGTGLVCLVVSISMKRGAIIALSAMMITWGLVDGLVRKRVGKAIAKTIVVMIVFCIALLCIDSWTGGYLSQRFSLESLKSGSGRYLIYKHALADISQRTLSLFVIGRGSGSSGEILGISAHNDWLEFLFSFGMVGLLYYALLYCVLTARMWLLIGSSSPFAPAYAMALIYMLFVSTYGQVYFAHSTLYLLALFGTIDGLAYVDHARYTNVE